VARVAEVGPEDRVLVLGASGAVGRLALQVARLRGAESVVGAARTRDDQIVGLGEIEDVFGSEGFTVCIDALWGEPLAAALAYAAPRARVVHVGQSAGPAAPVLSADVRGKELRILGHSNFALPRDERNSAYLELLDHVRAGRIVLDVERYPLDETGSAWERQRGPGRPKVVIMPADGR
jgi:NADPH2:quinone reductase